MNDLIYRYYQIRYSVFDNLIKLLEIDYPNYLSENNLDLYKSYKPENYTEFFLMKKSNGKIICISPQSNIYDINQFHPSQLSMMRIQFKSFPNYDWSNKNILDITNEYIDGMKIHLREIINEIISEINQSETNQSEINQSEINQFETNQSETNQSTINKSTPKHDYELKLIINEKIKRSQVSTYDGYCIQNIKDYLLDIDMCCNKLTRINIAIQIFDFIFINIDFLIKHQKFANTMIDKLIEMDNDIYGMFFSFLNIDKDSESYYEYLRIVLNFISALNRCKLKIIKDIQTDKSKELFRSAPFIIPSQVEEIKSNQIKSNLS